MVAITRISPEFLLDRLDGRYNSPLAVSVRKKIKASGLSTKKITDVFDLICGPFGSTLTADEHVENGEVLLIQPTNISGDTFSEDSSWRITKKDQIAKGLKLYPPGTLLFARVGVYPHTGVLPIESGLATISSSMIAGLPKNDVDTHYICAFFKSSHGFQLLLAAQKVTAQPTIGTSEIGGTEIPVPERRVQQYIGDKVRQAERLRAWAKARGAEVDSLVSNEAMNTACATPEKKHNRPQLDDLSHRLDPKYYGNRAVAVFRQAKAIGKPLASLVTGIANGFEERVFFDTGRDYITVTEVSSGRLELSSAPKISHATEVPDKAIIHESCALVVRTGSIGTAVKVDARDRGAVISSHLIRLEFADETDAAAVAAFLCSTAGRVLQHKISYGAVQPQIGQDELLALSIPQFVLNSKEQILALITEQESAIRASRALTTMAKFLVEALIEGQLSEAELIAAEQALQAGNDQPDRHILNRLKTDGVDGQGQPLLNDLDQLYSLLDQADHS